MHGQSPRDRKCFKNGTGYLHIQFPLCTANKEQPCGDREVLGPRCSHLGKGSHLDRVWEADAAGLNYMISFQAEFQEVQEPWDEVDEGLAIAKGRLTLKGLCITGQVREMELFCLGAWCAASE